MAKKKQASKKPSTTTIIVKEATAAQEESNESSLSSIPSNDENSNMEHKSTQNTEQEETYHQTSTSTLATTSEVDSKDEKHENQLQHQDSETSQDCTNNHRVNLSTTTTSDSDTICTREEVAEKIKAPTNRDLITTPSTPHNSETSTSTLPTNVNNDIAKKYEDFLKNVCEIVEQHSENIATFSERLGGKFCKFETTLEKSKQQTIKLFEHNEIKQKENSQKGTLLDPSVRQMLMGFMTQVDQLYEQRDRAITEKMSKMGSNLQKLSNNVKVFEEAKKKESSSEDKSITAEEAASNTQSTTSKVESNAEENLTEEELRKRCKEFEEKLKEKEKEFSSYKTKVAEWKEKVKVISNKDMKKIEELKKQVTTQEKTIEELNAKIEEINKKNETIPNLENSLNVKDDEIEKLKKEIASLSEKISQKDLSIEQHQITINEKNQINADLCEKLTSIQQQQQEAATSSSKKVPKFQDLKILKKLDLDSKMWFYVQHDVENTFEWIDLEELKQIHSDAQLNSPLDSLLPEKSILQIHEESFQQRLSEESKKLEEQIKLFNEKDEELKTYKTRAHAALKKKTDALNQAKLDYENQINELKESLTKQQEDNEEQSKLIQDLQEQVQSFIIIQEKAVKLGSDLDKVMSEKEDLEDKIKSLEKQHSKTKEDFNEEKSKLIQEYELQLRQLESKNSELDEQFRKELRVTRERNRRILDEKEREITKLQMKISENKQVTDEAEQVREKLVSLENEMNLIKEENESLKKQLTSMMNAESTPTVKTPRKVDQSQILSSALNDGPTTPTSISQDNISDLSPSVSTSDLTLERDFNQLMELAQLQASRDTEMMHYKETISKLKQIIKEREHSEKSFKILEKQLKEEIEHLQRLQKQGAPNLEYLKNILISFLTGEDRIVKEKLLKVLAQMMDLSKEEQDKISQKCLAEPSSSLWNIVSTCKCCVILFIGQS
nr:unnamed protein product [Naegleria fowleri]